MKISLLTAVITILQCLSSCSGNSLHDHIHNFTSGNESVLRRGSLGAPLVSVFCWRGRAPALARFWSSVTLHINISGDYSVHAADTAEEVEMAAAGAAVFWFLAEQSPPPRWISLNPFVSRCVGVTSDRGFSLDCRYNTVDPLALLTSALGVLVFTRSRALSRTKLIRHVLTLVTKTICCPLLISEHLRLKLSLSPLLYVPQHAFSAYVMLFSGYQVYQQDSYLSHWILGCWMLLCLVCHCTVPRPTTEHTAALVKLLGLLILLCSSYNWLASGGVALLLLVTSRPPAKKCKSTQLDSTVSGTTRAALEELRRYCLRPDVNAWGLAVRLKDPKHFADFILNTGTHVKEEEALLHREQGDNLANIGNDEHHLSSHIIRGSNGCDGHRFRCIFCSSDNLVLGHRFNCSHCFLDP